MEALIFGLFLFGLLAIAPIVSSIAMFFRTRSLRADVDALRERVRRLELDAPPPNRLRQGSGESAEALRAKAEGGSHAQPVAQAPATQAPVTAPAPSAPSVAAEVLPPKGGSHLTPVTQAAAPSAPAPSAPDAPLAPPALTESESLESRIGGRWLLYIGVAAIVIGVAYFEKLAIDNNWISETARVIQGGVLGALLVAAGMWFARAGYRGYGQMIAGGGFAVMYVSTYAAFNYYRLIDRPIAFLVLVAITVLAAWIADRQNSQGLAIFAVGGGFVTPFLLPGDTDAQIVLFTYDAILIAGTMFLATRRAWPFLNVISYVFTLMTVSAWFDRFYENSKYLRTELFITLFCVMFVIIARQCRRSDVTAARLASWFLWTAPGAYYLASLGILGLHPIPLLVWLIAVMLAGGILSVRVRPWIGFAIWVAVTVPLLGWTQIYTAQTWLAPGLAAVAGVYVIALASQLQIMASSERMRPVEIAWLHFNGLLMFAGAYFLLENSHLAIMGGLAAAFAAWHGVLAALVLGRWRDHALHFAALAFTLLAIAVALQFDGPAVTVGWAAEGAAIVALGLIEHRHWLRAGGLLLFVIAVTRALSLLVSVAPANHVVFLNPRAASAALIVGLSYLLAWLYRRETDVEERRFGIDAGVIIAQLVSIVLLTTEIRAYFAMSDSDFSREVMISVTWGAYATALILVGLFKRYAPIRYFGIALFALTILKVFFQDLAHLKQIYRVLSVMGLGILLLVTSYLYQRMRDKA